MPKTMTTPTTNMSRMEDMHPRRSRGKIAGATCCLRRRIARGNALLSVVPRRRRGSLSADEPMCLFSLKNTNRTELYHGGVVWAQ